MLLWRSLRPATSFGDWDLWTLLRSVTIGVISQGLLTHLLDIHWIWQLFFIYCALGMQKSLWLCCTWSLYFCFILSFLYQPDFKKMALYHAIIYLSDNFLMWTFSNIQRTENSVMNFFHVSITCFYIYQHFVKLGSSISTQFFSHRVSLKEIPIILSLYLKIFQDTSTRPFQNRKSLVLHDFTNYPQ